MRLVIRAHYTNIETGEKIILLDNIDGEVLEVYSISEGRSLTMTEERLQSKYHRLYDHLDVDTKVRVLSKEEIAKINDMRIRSSNA
jgi:hypothetical protein